MVEVSAEIGLGEEEIELDLGLSIGGSFKKPRPDSDLTVNLLDGKMKKKKKNKRWVMMRECDEVEGGMTKREKTDHGVFNNGFAFPCWALISNEKNVAPASSNRGFQSFLVLNNGSGGGSERNDERDGLNEKSMCSSSVVSEQQSSSHEGGGSTDSHSHSAHSLAEPTQLNGANKENNFRSKPEQSASSHPVISQNGKPEGRNHIVKEIQPKITPKPPTKLKEEPPSMNSKAAPIDNSSNDPLKETKTDMGKPPKPLAQTSFLPQMPYVSTTGKGPNGRTVNGFLYKYTKSEVSIVCVCHGSTFSPAEFVQHAGGTDISHPLRHITVIPSAFG